MKKRLLCPRCDEIFEPHFRYCQKCGLKKNGPFPVTQWWIMTPLVSLVLLLLVLILREVFRPTEGYAIHFTDGFFWIFPTLLFISLLLAGYMLFQISQTIWLWRYGQKVMGVVDGYREGTDSKGRKYTVSLVKFQPDIARSRPYEAEGPANRYLGTKVTVRYDPYNPGGVCAVAGLELVRIIFGIIIFLVVVSVVGLLALILITPVTT